MKKYQTLDGGIIQAANAHDFVKQMNYESWFSFDVSFDKFRENVSTQCKMMTGADIRVDSNENFLSDLLSNNFVKELVETEAVNTDGE